MKAEYSRKEVEKITGVPWRRIQFYTDQRVVNLSNPNPGRGRERKYSPKDVVDIALLGVMDKDGIELATIKKVMVDLPKVMGLEKEFLECRNHDAGFCAMIRDGKVNYPMERKRGDDGRPGGEPDEIRISIKDVSSAYVLNLGKIVRDLMAKG